MIIEPATIEIVKQLVSTLQTRKETLASAESCTCGMLSATITHHPGSSTIYWGGVNAYSNDLKERLLHVPKQCMVTHGSVSDTVALSMTQQIHKISGCDWAMGITGIAGPGGGTISKPVGTVFGAIIGRYERQHTWHQCFKGEREAIRNQAVQTAVSEFLTFLSRVSSDS